MRLFIAEKPSVAAAIATGLGGGKKLKGYYQCGEDRVAWCFGHMLEQAMPDHYLPDDVPLTPKGSKIWRAEDLPIVPKSWKLLPKEEAAEQLGVICNLLSEAAVIVNAGDPDREGQLLIDEILDEYECNKPVKRFISASLDEVTVKKALSKLEDNNDYRSMGHAALARSRADWLVGLNLTRAYTLANRAAGNQNLMTVGRVQSPTLRLVVERDQTIANFKPIPFFKPFADIDTSEEGAPAYRAWWMPEEDQTGMDDNGRLLDESVAKALSGGSEGTVVERSVTPREQRHPTCYSLADIQFSASKIFGYGAEQTLKICQSLYETHKLATYPRVDTGYLPESQFQEAATVMEALKKAAPVYAPLVATCDLSIRSKTWNDKKVSAHHGIIPTLSSRSTIDDLSDEERNVYDLIVRRYIAQFLPPHRYEETIIIHDVAGKKYRARGRTVVDAGWRAALEAETANLTEKADDESASLPVVEQGQSVSAACDYTRSKTTPPAYFTEGTLIRAMEQMHKHIDDPEMRKLLKASDGLGTSATRGNILADLQRRGFLATQKKNLVSTDIGQALIAALPSSITDPVLSARAEEMLKAIEEGTLTVDDFLARQTDFVAHQTATAANAQIERVPEKTYTCPSCGNFELMRKKSKDGKGHYWLCKGVFEPEEAKKCKTFLDDKNGKPVKPAAKKKRASSSNKATGKKRA
ncbi:DNA topoisomerase 3 [Kushneria indalinina]|uniref:DNA topoisomerase n=1 Tax=Kushneria indalinina DSM 14324 TaxID=1122140 RepID=A0A3D9DRH1_9GAMM|nr:DNA topoisomerase 3 [Kushneria indalinina]REC93333.1 DNA topoisomerase-3 [Kushneria indalinina DSM 14324]